MDEKFTVIDHYDQIAPVGTDVSVSIRGTVIETGGNYLVIETEDGDEITANNDWEIEVV
jgi:hypothetical protein